MQDFDVLFSVLECKKRESRSHGKRKNGNIKRKICTEKCLNTRNISFQVSQTFIDPTFFGRSTKNLIRGSSDTSDKRQF